MTQSATATIRAMNSSLADVEAFEAAGGGFRVSRQKQRSHTSSPSSQGVRPGGDISELTIMGKPPPQLHESKHSLSEMASFAMREPSAQEGRLPPINTASGEARPLSARSAAGKAAKKGEGTESGSPKHDAVDTTSATGPSVNYQRMAPDEKEAKQQEQAGKSSSMFKSHFSGSSMNTLAHLDNILDHVVMLNPRLRWAVVNGPAISYEVVKPGADKEREDRLKKLLSQYDATMVKLVEGARELKDKDKTFLTSVDVPDSEKPEEPEQVSPKSDDAMKWAASQQTSAADSPNSPWANMYNTPTPASGGSAIRVVDYSSHLMFRPASAGTSPSRPISRNRSISPPHERAADAAWRSWRAAPALYPIPQASDDGHDALLAAVELALNPDMAVPPAKKDLPGGIAGPTRQRVAHSCRPNLTKQLPPPIPLADYYLHHRKDTAIIAPSYHDLCSQIRDVQRQYTCGSPARGVSTPAPPAGGSPPRQPPGIATTTVHQYISGIDGPPLIEIIRTHTKPPVVEAARSALLSMTRSSPQKIIRSSARKHHHGGLVIDDSPELSRPRPVVGLSGRQVELQVPEHLATAALPMFGSE